MTARSPGAFMLSAFFHAVIIGIILFFAFMTQQEKTTTHVLELVTGEGDNFGATVAPKLGTPNGVKVDIPAMPAPQPEPEPQPVVTQTAPPEPEPTPVTPAPEPVQPQPVITPAPKAPPQTTVTPVTPAKKQLTLKQQFLHKVWQAEGKAKREVAKQRAEEAARQRKEEAERKQRDLRAKAASQRTTSAKYSPIDAEGIARGVVGGSADNKVGGAGGKALSRDDGPVLDAYFSMLKQRVLAALDKPPGVSDDIATKVVVTIHADGRLTGARVEKSSGSDDFDRAVIAAFSRVTMPAHPEHKTEELELTFKTKDAG